MAVDMYFGGWRAQIRERSFDMQGFDVFLYTVRDQKIIALQPDGSIREFAQHEAVPLDTVKPTATWTREQMQALVDSCAAQGITPDKRRHAQEMDLVQAHLADMRRLVFDAKPAQR